MAFGWGAAIGICGGALAIVLGAIKIWEFFRDRSAVRVSLCRENRGPNDPRGPYLVTTAVNKGRRPVTIEEIGIEYVGGTKLLANVFWPPDLRPPATLTESQGMKGFIHAEGPLKGGTVRAGYARDSVGRLYRSRTYVHPAS